MPIVSKELEDDQIGVPHMSNTDNTSEVKDYCDHDHYWLRRKVLNLEPSARPPAAASPIGSRTFACGR